MGQIDILVWQGGWPISKQIRLLCGISNKMAISKQWAREWPVGVVGSEGTVRRGACLSAYVYLSTYLSETGFHYNPG